MWEDRIILFTKHQILDVDGRTIGQIPKVVKVVIKKQTLQENTKERENKKRVIDGSFVPNGMLVLISYFMTCKNIFK